ncbi:MAG: hypothetical protein ACHRXM_35885, partial [Isosphaerales bacterium]
MVLQKSLGDFDHGERKHGFSSEDALGAFASTPDERTETINKKIQKFGYLSCNVWTRSINIM